MTEHREAPRASSADGTGAASPSAPFPLPTWTLTKKHKLQNPKRENTDPVRMESQAADGSNSLSHKTIIVFDIVDQLPVPVVDGSELIHRATRGESREHGVTGNAVVTTVLLPPAPCPWSCPSEQWSDQLHGKLGAGTGRAGAPLPVTLQVRQKPPAGAHAPRAHPRKPQDARLRAPNTH